MGRNPGTGCLIGMKRPRGQIVETQKYRHEDHAYPSSNEGEALHQILGYDERIPNLATVNCLATVSESIVIVTPVWNDATRLTAFGGSLAAAFAKSSLPIQWVIADDGSSSAEIEHLKSLQSSLHETFPHINLHLANAHRGKGSIIREAWGQYPDATWLAFTDADGSVSANDLLGLVDQARSQQQSVIGIRKRTKSTQITESLYRSFFHHGYLLVVHLFLGLRSEDLQCGAKVIRGSDYRHIAHHLVEDGFPFDTELLTTLKHSGSTWLEIPVTWREKRGGKVRPLIDAWSMFAAVLRIRARHW